MPEQWDSSGSNLGPHLTMPWTLQPPNAPEADLLMPPRWWVRLMGWMWAVMMAIALFVALVDGLNR